MALRFHQCGGGPRLHVADAGVSRGELLAKRSLLGEESLAVASLDAPVQPGDDRSGVLGDDECLLVGQLPELLRPQNRDLLGVDRAPASAAAVSTASIS